MPYLHDLLREEDLQRVLDGAAAENVDPTAWAIFDGVVDEEAVYRALARWLALPFVADPPATPMPQRLPDRRDFERLVRMRGLGGGRAVLAPDDASALLWRDRFEREPELRAHFVITTPSASRRTLTRDLSPLLLREAVDGLSQRRPDLSARTLSGAGGWAVALPLLALATVLLVPSDIWPGVVARVVNIVASAIFALFVWSRLSIALETSMRARARGIARVPPEAFPSEAGMPVPFYTVLVALYREGNQVVDLVAALDRLDWPRVSREIVLVCEGDDAQTLDALARLSLPPDMRVVRVPASEPRTKPKALDYALPTCRGDFVVLYDAEDRPDPLQLREAWAAFRSGPERLACVQAPLHIANADTNRGWGGLLPKLFAAEYSALFDSFLPALAARGGPVPLGGTSNHFKRTALDECGAWDGWNVTEDADLGVRLARAGWSIDTITRATHEEAPAFLRPWITQRTRWFKGWMQTWLVHMRSPRRLWRELGPRAFVTFHIFITGMLISALVHPLFLVSVLVNGVWIALEGWSGPVDGWHRALIALDLVVISSGYLAFALAAWRTMKLRGLAHLRPWLMLVPVYWIAMSWAAWRALWQLQREPSKWEKTPHGLS